MTFNQLFVEKKIKGIQEYIEEIEELLEFPDKEILKDSGKMHIAERLVQLVVDAMLDINQHIIKERNLKETEDFQSTFYTLAESGILPLFANSEDYPVLPVVARVNMTHSALGILALQYQLL